MKNEYFENHPVFRTLKFHEIIGLIQLMIDEGMIGPEERTEMYLAFKNFREGVKKLYDRLTEDEKREYIAYFRYKHHLIRLLPD